MQGIRASIRLLMKKYALSKRSISSAMPFGYSTLRAFSLIRHIGHLLFAASTLIAAECVAGGTLGTEDLENLLRQQPTAYEALKSTIILSDSAYAKTRLGPQIKALGGARVGPYIIEGTLKQSHKKIDVVLCTRAEFLSSNGKPLPLDRIEEAVRIDETLTSIVLREPSQDKLPCP